MVWWCFEVVKGVELRMLVRRNGRGCRELKADVDESWREPWRRLMISLKYIRDEWRHSS